MREKICFKSQNIKKTQIVCKDVRVRGDAHRCYRQIFRVFCSKL